MLSLQIVKQHFVVSALAIILAYPMFSASAESREPNLPKAIVEEQVSFSNVAAGLRLAGAVTRPRDGDTYSTILLVSGSGPQDRHGTVAGKKMFRTAARAFAESGFLVLGYDDRGVGRSEGDTYGTTVDAASDAEAAVKYLKTRKDVRRDRIGIIGHSEGGLIGPILSIRRDDVAFLVLLAGPTLHGAKILRDQIKAILVAAGGSMSEAASNDARVARMINAAKSDDNRQIALVAEQLRTELKETAAWSKAQIQFFSSRWTRFFLSYDPQPSLLALRTPVLALYGEHDLQVSARTNAHGAEAALVSNSDATVLVLKNHNHLFQVTDDGSPDLYRNLGQAPSDQVIDIIVRWLSERF